MRVRINRVPNKRLVAHVNNRILIVDDERGIVAMLKRYFEAQNYDVSGGV